MNLAFVGPLRHAGLALAIGLGACLNAFLLYRILRGEDLRSAARLAGVHPQSRRLRGGHGGRAVSRHGTARLVAGSELAAQGACVLGLVVLGALVYGVCLGLSGLRPRHFRAARPE